jgi:glucosylceramidase
MNIPAAKFRCLVIPGVILAMSCIAPIIAQTASWRSTTNQDRWVDKGPLASTAWSGATAYFEIFPDSQFKPIEGFGGCFNEKGWNALSVLSAAGRDSVMRALFDTSGCNFTVCRMPIGSNDFADNYYSLNDSAGDYAMTNFNLTRDKNNLIPFMKAAMVHKPNLKVWGSPWCPPQWMKTTKTYSGDGHLTQDAQTLGAFALYLEKAVTAFQAEGINLSLICAQNEPTQGAGQNYPSCVWSPTEYMDFYKNYLIPRFKAGVKADLMWGTFCCGTYKDWIFTPMFDSVISKNVTIIGVQQVMAPSGYLSSTTNTDFPAKLMYETETNCCHNNDWAGGLLEFNLLANWLKNYAVVYSQWNMILDETGLSGWNWKQASMVTVNKTSKAVTYNPHFYAVKHFGNAILPGARLLGSLNTDKAYKSSIAAFINPNGNLVVVAACTTAAAYPLTIKIGTKAIAASLPGRSFNTFVIKIPTSPARPPLPGDALPDIAGIRATGSALILTVHKPSSLNSIEFLLYDLKGALIWSGECAGGEFRIAGTHRIGMRTAPGGVPPGTYFLEMKAKDGKGLVATQVEKVAMLKR